jgi:hypothetical protein
MTLIDPDPTVALDRHDAEPPTAEGSLALFERLAKDPNATVDKIERLMALWERGEARKAEGAFNTAMAAAQTAMRPVSTDADNPQTRSRYASYAQLDTALRPIYTRAGFGLSFDTGESTLPEHVRVLCYVSHRDGFSRTYHVDMPSDGKGARGGDVMTKTHAVGSALTYGMRYLLKMIFNVAVGEDDDDGNQASARPARRDEREAPKPPKYDEQWTDLSAVADEGTAAFDKAWAGMSGAFKNYTIEHRKDAHNDLKAKAARVTAGKR